ncbi:MAG TPA: DNA-binding protein [bacterium]|nr:DNA-binding protein [bacterium]HOL35326.1 DNA-binding protein [bacterium]HPP08733.1 DNA-binding protein [bacterium]
MKYSQAKIKRAFVVRLEDGEKLPDAIEDFARKHKIQCGICMLIGGIGSGKLVTGPRYPESSPIIPIFQSITGISEIAGIGTIFPDENNIPKLHMHATTGRKKTTLTGCIRPGITVWKIGECIILELVGAKAKRIKDKKAGFSVLEPDL